MSDGLRGYISVIENPFFIAAELQNSLKHD